MRDFIDFSLRSRVALVGLCLLVCHCDRLDAETKRQRAVAAKAATPRLTVDEAMHDFGVVQQGALVEHGFKLTNTGSAQLVIEDVSATCACAVAELEHKQLAPGASTELKVRYRPTSMTGADHQTLRVRSNDPDQVLTELVINAVVPPDIRFEPPVMRLGADAAHSAAVSQLKGMVVTRANLHLAEVRGDPNAAKAVRVTVISGPYDQKRRPEIRASLKRTNVKPGRVVAVVLTGLPDPTQILVPIEWGTTAADPIPAAR